MKDANDTSTIDGIPAGPGRPRKYASAADRQRAYREKKKAAEMDYEIETKRLFKKCREMMKESKDGGSERQCARLVGVADGIVTAWRLTIGVKISGERYDHWSEKFDAVRYEE